MASHKSLWSAITPRPNFPALQEDREVDVIVVGAGITGLTAAYCLAKEGKKVAVLDKHHVGSGETGMTTAHLTQAIDTRYPQLTSDFGKEGARLVAESNGHAIDFIERTLGELGEVANFERLPGYLYAEFPQGIEFLKEELEAARNAGLNVRWEDRAPLPFANRGAVRYENQGQMQPLRYLNALASDIVRRGSFIFENTAALEFSDGDPVEVRTENGKLTGKALFVATNTPISNRVFLHTKVFAYRTYAVAFEPNEEKWLGGLFWDLDDPYHYTRCERLENGKVVYIVGGEDHKTGEQSTTEVCYTRLERYCRSHFGVRDFRHYWSGQIMEPVDGLPFIGRNSLSRHEYVATGFTGNGTTFGTIAGLLVTDLILGRENKWESLYKATRIKPLSSATDYVTENVDYPRYFIEDRLRKPAADSLDDVMPGEGKMVKVNGKSVAAYRDEKGSVSLLSPVCPHLGCHVHFNSAEKSWDCPCHGSRFTTDGEVINGPAVANLSPVDAEGKAIKEKIPGAA